MPNWNKHYVVDIAMSFALMCFKSSYCNTGFQHVMLSGAKRSRNIPGNGHLVAVVQQALQCQQFQTIVDNAHENRRKQALPALHVWSEVNRKFSAKSFMQNSILR